MKDNQVCFFYMNWISSIEGEGKRRKRFFRAYAREYDVLRDETFLIVY